MEYFAILILNIIGAALVAYLEKSDDAIEKKKSLMGEWPFNIVLLLGLAAQIGGDMIEHSYFTLIIALASTSIFFLIRCFRLVKPKL